jgi:uncharacterized membrane protein
MNTLENEEIKDVTHISFEILLFFKALNAIGEIIGGILLIFFSPMKIQNFINLISRQELLEDPKDFIMNALINFSNNFSIGLEHFFIFYLLYHGIIKIIIVTLLYKKKTWAYPLSIIVLIIFVVYQIYRIFISYSNVILLLTILDIILILLTWLEYKKIKKS